MKRHAGSYGYDEYIFSHFNLLKSVYVVQIYVAATTNDIDQGSNEKPVTELKNKKI